MEKLLLRRIDRSSDDQEMLLNFGPQHPSTHGVLNFLVVTDGEVMKRAIPDIGYLHRSLEKIGEKVGYPGFMPYTDRIDYVAAMFANEGYALAVETLCGARLTYNYHRIGGVAFDLPSGWRDRCLSFLDHFDSLVQEWDRLI